MNEFKQAEDQTVVGIDTRGQALTHYVIAERLVALDCTYIIDDGSRYDDVEYLADKLSNGWRGYHRMSPGELWTEYKEIEESFLELYDTNELVVGLKDDDPLERAGAN